MLTAVPVHPWSKESRYPYADCKLQAAILPDFMSRSSSKPIFWPSTSSRIPARSTAEI